jgi:hypothetical protein
VDMGDNWGGSILDKSLCNDEGLTSRSRGGK